LPKHVAKTKTQQKDLVTNNLSATTKAKFNIQHILGIILDDTSQAFNADILQIVAVGSDKPADARGRGVQEDRVGINSGHRLHHLVYWEKQTEISGGKASKHLVM